jgi:hypothetical protein
LPHRRIDKCEIPPLQGAQRFAGDFHLNCLLIATILCLYAAVPAQCQDAAVNLSDSRALAVANDIADAIPPAWVDFQAETNTVAEALAPAIIEAVAASEGPTGRTTQTREPVESDLVMEALASYGHYRIFASGSGCKLYTAGVEYDRHSWGRFMGARMDYVAEFLPVVLLYAPVTQDIWGSPTSPNKHIVPGIGFSPIGFRWLWRDKRAIKPYLMAKGGMLGFPQKVLSQKATYVDFSLQSAMGVNVKVDDRWDLRLGLFSDFHFSDDFIVPVNPGLDVMNANLGLSYNFGKRRLKGSPMSGGAGQ